MDGGNVNMAMNTSVDHSKLLLSRIANKQHGGYGKKYMQYSILCWSGSLAYRGQIRNAGP